MRATAIANANIALVKYWGKRDPALNLPESGSISLTLKGLETTTTVSFGESREDEFILDGVRLIGPGAQKVFKVVDLIRGLAALDAPVHIESRNDFPTAAGLASSSSGFAALAVAAATAAGLELSPKELSVIARRGSGSACRSIEGGFVEWQCGEKADGSDSFGLQLHPADHWPMTIIIAVVDPAAKPVSSTEGMQMTAQTSPYHKAFIQGAQVDLKEVREAISVRDFGALQQVAERSALRMHADMMAGDPGLLYMNSQTLKVLHHVRRMQDWGMRVFFTVDAGPNVKLFCENGHQGGVVKELRGLSCVQEILWAYPGAGAQLVDP
jgi:diphosphomevalonate decarboxylase